jgi:hypothetical protein
MAQLLSNTRIYGFASTDGQLSVGNVNSFATTSNSTGSLIVTGGVGISGNVFTSGNITISTVTTSTSNITGALRVTGGVGIIGNTYTGNLVISGSSAAGNGITFADGTRQTTAAAASSVATYNTTIGDGANTKYQVLHNLAKSNIITVVRETTSGNIVYPSLQYANTNQINVSFVSAPASSFYTVSVMGF